jgi:uncharacterized membrane protein YbaN (DUF454 family)
VVRSSAGRLRVHLPHWSRSRAEDVVREVQRLAGVTRAEISPLTGNILILFEPGQTTADTLLEQLPTVRLGPPTPAPPVALAEGTAEAPPPDFVYKTGLARWLYQALGWASVGMAFVGAATPGIPTAPFVILAGYFFIRSSPEAHQWLRNSRWFGWLLRDWERYRGVRRSVRNLAVGLIAAGMVFTLLLGLPRLLTAAILTLQVIGIAIVLSLRVIDPETPSELTVA